MSAVDSPMPAAGGPGPRMRMGRVVGKSTFAGTRVAVPVGPGPESRPDPEPTHRLRPTLMIAGGFVGLAALVLILNFSLPWIRTEGNFSADGGLFFGFGDSNLDRADLEDGAADVSDYLDDLLDWPVIALVGLLVASPLMVVAEVVHMRSSWRRLVRRALLVLCALLGFVVFLTGTRWLGLYIGELWHAGGADFHLHVVPYLNLVSGAAVVAAAGWVLWRDLRRDGATDPDAAFPIAALTAGVAALALLLAPLLPYATAKSDFDDETEYWGEFYFDLFRDVGSRGVEKPGEDLHTARLMVWIVLYVAIAASLVALARRDVGQPLLWSTLGQMYAPLAFLLVTGLVFAALFYVHLPELEEAVTVGGLFTTDVAPHVNVVLPLALVALAALYVVYVRKVLTPFARQLSQLTRPTPGPEAPRMPPAPPTFERR